ncbi:CDP-diacylglycerol--serine O-phosphatidyltransferase [Vibrio albus]|uniref:CDP-diacylglycerol--serine O-phosphatidyltransferase n=1 Tax=Vibrio albus TaxID=2200953 RepID=A0A2U3BAE9_9VIBR|nr:CDP-diacylglycerol--serine O-phosphatidyltransferase [Vibrio albus]PWI33776.1 CDP-diacylglycerol--serine O-phosphatidyltransferase [Vibrio albus]
MMALRQSLEKLPAIAIHPEQFGILFSADEFRKELIKHIRGATQRIYIAALYLENDDAGREILTELYQAKQTRPELDIKICVDWHRAQRGRIGEGKAECNAEFYMRYSNQYEHKIPVYGIPVRGKEVFGVLHLKGFVIDDSVIYSGASLNNIYLSYNGRYRFDRYHTFHNKALADSMVRYIQEEMIDHPAVHRLCDKDKPVTKELKPVIRQFRASLANSCYRFEPQTISEEDIAVTPLVGIGKRRNRLNQRINQLISSAKDEIFICTPYFNFPKSVAKEVKKALRRGVKVSIVVGDKTANDFYIPPEEPFKTIGGLPYLYEMNLRRFAKINESNIAQRKLSIHLWKHDTNSFHLKGIWVDKRYMLLTGNNLNPRAWKLDLENALLIRDSYHHLTELFEKEATNILEHTTQVCSYKQIDKIHSYPPEVQRLLKRITRVRADRILKQIL